MATKKKNPDTGREEWHVYFGEWTDYESDILDSGRTASLSDAIRCGSLEEAEEALSEGLTLENEEVGVIVHVQFTPVKRGEAVPRNVSITPF